MRARTPRRRFQGDYSRFGFLSRRFSVIPCLVVVDSFQLTKHRKPYLIQLVDDQPFGLGGVWDCWQSEDEKLVASRAIITTVANELVQPINDRMPVIIAPDAGKEGGQFQAGAHHAAAH